MREKQRKNDDAAVGGFLKNMETRIHSWAVDGVDKGLTADQATQLASDMLSNWTAPAKKSILTGACIAIIIFAIFCNKNNYYTLIWYISAIVASYFLIFIYILSWERSEKQRTVFVKSFLSIFVARFLAGLAWGATLIEIENISTNQNDRVVFGIGVALMSMPLFGGSVLFSMSFWVPVTISFGILLIKNAGQFGYGLVAAYVIYSILMFFSISDISNRSNTLNLTYIKLKTVSDYLSIAVEEFEDKTYDWIWMTDENNIIRNPSPGFSRASGLNSELEGLSFIELIKSHNNRSSTPGPEDSFVHLLNKMNQKNSFRKLIVPYYGQGNVKWWSLSGRPNYSSNKFIGYIGIGSDVTEEYELKNRNEYLAHHDALTGLFNRHKFNDFISMIYSNYSCKTVSFIVIDLDKFKFINDTYGHKVGDSLLFLVSRRISSHTRLNDCAARLGGDEFCVILLDLDRGEAESVANRILNSLREPYQIDDLSIVIGASAGMSFASLQGSDPEKLLQSADFAALQAKNQNRGGLIFGEPINR